MERVTSHDMSNKAGGRAVSRGGHAKVSSKVEKDKIPTL
jgi:hypothetical protein